MFALTLRHVGFNALQPEAVAALRPVLKAVLIASASALAVAAIVLGRVLLYAAGHADMPMYQRILDLVR
ncbi:MAG: hypothetical protein JNK11_05760 [Alphaproteobacteria bacterium]|nr:hypothetical protein [Alphaproteobacteria bacterium]